MARFKPAHRIFLSPATSRAATSRPATRPIFVIEILSTPRGNVERTEKIDDYALAGIGEYWIVDPFQRAVEIYRLSEGVYREPEIVSQGGLRPGAFPGLEIAVPEIWPEK